MNGSGTPSSAAPAAQNDFDWLPSIKGPVPAIALKDSYQSGAPTNRYAHALLDAQQRVMSEGMKPSVGRAPGAERGVVGKLQLISSFAATPTTSPFHELVSDYLNVAPQDRITADQYVGNKETFQQVQTYAVSLIQARARTMVGALTGQNDESADRLSARILKAAHRDGPDDRPFDFERLVQAYSKLSTADDLLSVQHDILRYGDHRQRVLLENIADVAYAAALEGR